MDSQKRSVKLGGQNWPVQNWTVQKGKLGRVVRMVVDSMLPHAEGGPNDYRKEAPPFRICVTY